MLPSVATTGRACRPLELSKSEGLVDGEVVTVTLASWLPGKTVTVVTCYNYPAAGPSDCELSNYGTHTTAIGDDGTGTLEYPVSVVPGRCDETTPCLVVAGDGFGANANYAAQQFTFAGADAAEPEPAEETTEPEPAEEPAEETTEPEPAEEPAEETTEPEPAEEPATVTTEPEPAEETATVTTEPEPAEESATVTTEPEPAEETATVTAEPEPAEETAASEAAAAAADDDGGGGSVWVWLLPVIIAAVVLALVARLLTRRRSAA